MTTFWWVRHGPTHEKSFVGWRDVPADLSDAAALSRLENYLPKDALVVSSDLSRCMATADAIQGARRRLPHDKGLRELHFGDWDGKHFSEVSALDPELSRLYWEDPGDHTPPNGESWNQAEARITKAVQELETKFPSKDVVIVAHFGAILTQLARAHQISPAQVLAQKIDNLSVTRITSGGQTGPINHCP